MERNNCVRACLKTQVGTAADRAAPLRLGRALEQTLDWLGAME